MRKQFRLFAALLLTLMLWPAVGSAQNLDQQLPLDPDVRYGVLPNGLTYYIRHNEYPKGQADFYIAQKVGSILENDDQRGLAHFLEHMCFNGTENFPGNSLIDWLATIGVKFGNNLNAYTSVDETVYNITNVPTARESVQDSVLLILHDWADGLTLDPQEIDKERGVIHQEWRRSNVGQMRILENLLPVMYPGSKYGYRLPIGTMEVVDNFAPQTLRDYYETWYRPDQQGIIVVGDIDVDRIEGKIKELFGPIKMPENPLPREYFQVPDHQGTIYAIGRDVEMPYSIVSLSFLTDALPDSLKNTPVYYLQEYMERMISSMLNQRFDDLSRDPNAVFSQAGVSFGNYMVSKTKDALDVTGVAKGESLEPVLEAMYREVLRAAKSGFTQSEYDRAKDEYLAALDRAYNNRETRENGVFVKEYVNNFINNEAAPGIETDYQLEKMIAQMIPLQAINSLMAEAITPDNRVVLAMTPEKDGVVYPTEQSLADVIAAVEAEDIAAFVDNVKTQPLIPKLPKPGKIKSESYNAQWGATEWVLSNGVKVLVKPTKFKEDEIKFLAVANGGTSVFPESYASSLIFLPYSLSTIGLGDYNNSDLQKYLKGKTADIDLSFDDYTRDLSGTTTPKDLPTLMELIYMSFVAPSLDLNEFEGLKSALSGMLANAELNPDFIFSTKVKESLYSSPRMQQISSSIVSGADRDQTLEVIKTMVNNAADYTFIFVGNVDPQTLKPLVEQYIATLPANAKKAQKGMPKFIAATQAKGGKGVDSYNLKMETPQTTVYIEEWGNMPYTAKNRAIASIVGQILTTRLLESVREREGAVYSIGASGGMMRVSPQNTMVVSSFPMNPEKKDLVLSIIEQEFANMANSIAPDELQKVQEYMVKNHFEGLEKNDNWIGMMGGFARNQVDLLNGYDAVINSITTRDVADFMKALNAQGNYRVILLEPAE